MHSKRNDEQKHVDTDTDTDAHVDSFVKLQLKVNDYDTVPLCSCSCHWNSYWGHYRGDTILRLLPPT